jgi:uncharacterized alkaline shock family protein YloU
MKVVQFFVFAFSVLVYLTVGSLLVIMALRIVPVEDVYLAIEQMYSGFWDSMQILVTGFLFVSVGLVFAKMLIARNRAEDSVVFQSEMGRISVSLDAIEDIVRKALKKFLVIKDCKIKRRLQDGELDILIRLTLWSAMNIPDLVREVQDDIRQKLARVLGMEYPIEIKAEVVKVEEHMVEDELVTPPSVSSSKAVL